MRSVALGVCITALVFTLGADACAAPAIDPFRAAAATIAGFGRTLDDANTDDFIAASLAAGDPVAPSQPCARPDRTVATRTTPLANPAFPAAAIDQREQLLRALEAYEELRVAVSGDDTEAELLAIAGDYRAALTRLEAAAALHGPGDLFVDEAAASLDPAGTASSVAALTKKLSATGDRISLERLIDAQHPTISKLIVIAFDDASANRAQAEAVTARVASRWQRYAETAAATTTAPTGETIGTFAGKALPACDEPFFVPAQSGAVPAETTMPPAIRARFQSATRQHQTLVTVAAELGTFFATLAYVNDTPRDDTTALQSAYAQFATAAQQIAETGASLR